MSIWHTLLRRLRDPRNQQIDKGWAGRSLEASIVRGLALGMIALQLVTAVIALGSLGLAPPALALVAGHLAIIACAVAVLRVGRGQLPLIAGAWAMFVADWAQSPTPESPLLFAACWMCNLTSTLPVMLLNGRSAWRTPLAATVLLPAAMVLVRPEWAGLALVPGVAVTLLAITVATRIGVSYVVDYTDAADAEARALEARTAALTTRKAATHQSAEDARVLHDTAINTLGAIASGGAAIDDVDAVRQRCLADIAAIEALRSARGDDLAARPGLRDAIRPVGIRVRHVGLSGAALADVEARLPTPVLQALSRAAGEAVQNAAKHSGAEDVEVAVTRTATGLRMAIRDHGVGMPPDRGGGSGVARSILQRTGEAGIAAAIDSAPGRGTAITLTYDFEPPPAAQDADGHRAGTLEELLHQLRTRVVFALSAGLVAVGVALAALNHPGEATPEWLMALVAAIACGLAWRERERPRLSAPTVIALIIAGPLAFVLSAWAVGFGRTLPFLWQAVGPTGPLLVLLIAPLPRAIRALGFAVYALTAAALTAGMAPLDPQAAIVIAVAGLVGLGLPSGVAGFIRGLTDVATRAHQAQQQTFAVGLQMIAIDAAAESRQRWRDAGLEQSVDLLRAIGLGAVDPLDPAVRQRCAEEEAFLRQLSLLDPELIQMGSWFARALNRARQCGIGLTVRAGAADTTADDADQFGETLLRVVGALPSGTALTTSLFPTARGSTMTLVAPTPQLVRLQALIRHPVRLITARTLGQQDWVEMAAPGGST